MFPQNHLGRSVRWCALAQSIAHWFSPTGEPNPSQYGQRRTRAHEFLCGSWCYGRTANGSSCKPGAREWSTRSLVGSLFETKGLGQKSWCAAKNSPCNVGPGRCLQRRIESASSSSYLALPCICTYLHRHLEPQVRQGESSEHSPYIERVCVTRWTDDPSSDTDHITDLHSTEDSSFQGKTDNFTYKEDADITLLIAELSGDTRMVKQKTTIPTRVEQERLTQVWKPQQAQHLTTGGIHR